MTEEQRDFGAHMAVRIRHVHTILHKSAVIRYGRELGLTAAEWRSIVFIGIRGPMTIGALSELLQVDRSLVSRLTDSLTEKKLVTRGKENADRRRSVISLTEGGQKVYEHIRIISRERDSAIRAALTKDEQRHLESALGKLETLAQRWIGEEETKTAKG